MQPRRVGEHGPIITAQYSDYLLTYLLYKWWQLPICDVAYMLSYF